jgi:hypothetical protein
MIKYDSIAINKQQIKDYNGDLLKEVYGDYEVLLDSLDRSVVYLRKHLEGDIASNTGWSKI